MLYNTVISMDLIQDCTEDEQLYIIKIGKTIFESSKNFFKNKNVTIFLFNCFLFSFC